MYTVSFDRKIIENIHFRTKQTAKEKCTLSSLSSVSINCWHESSLVDPSS